MQFSKGFNDILKRMLEFDLRFRPDFLELYEIVKMKFPIQTKKIVHKIYFDDELNDSLAYSIMSEGNNNPQERSDKSRSGDQFQTPNSDVAVELHGPVEQDIVKILESMPSSVLKLQKFLLNPSLKGQIE